MTPTANATKAAAPRGCGLRCSVRPPEARSGRGDSDPGVADLDRRAGADLAPTAAIDLAVDADLAVLDQGPGLRAVINDASQLQQLTEPDHLVADGNIDTFAHVVSVTDDVRSRLSASARGREAGHPGIRGLTFVRGHGTPHPVWLTDRQGVLTAALHDRAAHTHGLGREVPVAP